MFLICRGDHPVIIYDQQGNFKRSWGEGEFSYRTHGIYVAPNGTIFCTDDGNHTVRQFTPEGKLLMTMGVLNTPSDTGYDGKNITSIKRGGGPLQPSHQCRHRPEGRHLYHRRLRQRARAHLFADGPTEAVVGRAGQRSRPVLPAARHRGRCRRARLRLRPRERPHPDLQSGRRVLERVDGHAAAHAPVLRFAGPRLRDGTRVARGRHLADASVRSPRTKRVTRA